MPFSVYAGFGPCLARPLRQQARMNIEGVRARIRLLREAGEIPCEAPEKTWAGRGRNSVCAACGDMIAESDIEFEVDLRTGVMLRMHRRCHDVWLEECGERAPFRG